MALLRLLLVNLSIRRHERRIRRADTYVDLTRINGGSQHAE